MIICIHIIIYVFNVPVSAHRVQVLLLFRVSTQAIYVCATEKVAERGHMPNGKQRQYTFNANKKNAKMWTTADGVLANE